MTDITLTQEQFNAILAAFGQTIPPALPGTPQQEWRFNVSLSAALRIGSYGSEAPTASFSYVVNGQDVTFTYTGEGAETVVWNFGDGGNGTVQLNPTHTYAGSGPFTVTLTAYNPMGQATTSQVINLTPPVSASFTYVKNGLEVTFTDTSTGATSWSWDFGDGSPADTTQNPVHTYAGHGTYNVELTINGGADSDTQAVSVNTAFNAAMVAAGMRRIYDIQETSGLVADNAGTDGAGGDGAYVTVTLGQTDVNGTNDAGILQSGGVGYLTVPTITGTIPALTMLLLVKASGAIQVGSAVLGATSSGYVFVDVFDDGGGTYIKVDILNDNGGNATFQTPVNILATNALTAFYITYDGENIAMWKATSATLSSVTPDASTAASPTGGLTSLIFASGGGIFGDYAATSVTLSAFALDDAAFNSTQLGAINSAINW